MGPGLRQFTRMPRGASSAARERARERHHDADFRKRTSGLEAELQTAGQVHTPDGHARIAALEDEKLQSYQRRYEEYVQIGKGLADLLDGNSK